MAERDQLVRLLRRHDAGDARRAEHVALLGVAAQDEVERRRRHHDAALRHRDAIGHRLVRHVDHPRLAAAAEMGELLRAAMITPRRERRGHLAREQRARRRRDIGLPHQAFADEEGR